MKREVYQNISRYIKGRLLFSSGWDKLSGLFHPLLNESRWCHQKKYDIIISIIIIRWWWYNFSSDDHHQMKMMISKYTLHYLRLHIALKPFHLANGKQVRCLDPMKIFPFSHLKEQTVSTGYVVWLFLKVISRSLWMQDINPNWGMVNLSHILTGKKIVQNVYLVLLITIFSFRVLMNSSV